MIKIWEILFKTNKNDEFISWAKWDMWQVLGVGIVVIVFGYLFYVNLDEAIVKSHDWERKEQAKRAYNALEEDYLRLVKVFPPNSDSYAIKGCGDEFCPVDDNQGSNCIWASDKPGISYVCGGRKWFDVAPIQDNPKTKGPDRVKYKRLGLEEAVVEVCLERYEDPEAIPVAKSKIGWTEDDCPSGAILIWPSKYVE